MNNNVKNKLLFLNSKLKPMDAFKLLGELAGMPNDFRIQW